MTDRLCSRYYSALVVWVRVQGIFHDRYAVVDLLELSGELLLLAHCLTQLLVLDDVFDLLVLRLLCRGQHRPFFPCDAFLNRIVGQS